MAASASCASAGRGVITVSSWTGTRPACLRVPQTSRLWLRPDWTDRTRPPAASETRIRSSGGAPVQVEERATAIG